MKRNQVWAAIVVGISLCQTAVLCGQAPDPGKYSAEQFEVQATRGHKAAMRDGVRLSVDVFQPKAEGRFPAILIITPYSNNPGYQPRATWFAKRGYVVAVADSRGRFDSEGEWDPFDAKHKTDGYDLVEWLAARPWCDGKVGMMGLSYMGWTQWWSATQGPPSLRAIVPEVAPPDAFANGPYQNGVLVCWMMDWMVRLVDVRPDGYAALLCEGLMRARHRDPSRNGAFNSEKLSDIEPHRVYEYTIDFWRATGNVFAKGHRIRVEISSSYFPYYLRNLNTGADNIGLETKAVVAEQKIFHTTEHPSHVVLPVIPAR